MEFFTDRDLGPKIFPNILQAAGIIVHRHIDHFPNNAPDSMWLPAVAQHGWIILSCDQAILRNPLERDAIMASGAGFFALVGGHAPVEQLARNFVNTFPKVKDFLKNHPRPFIANIYRPNPVTKLTRESRGKLR